ncbi:hypothetical protein ABI59_23760 [Acidobacteria bacterium Mor1]|nr:hypothetical protein ABI59_23760 [Acidobacteria bacterium Mor1]
MKLAFLGTPAPAVPSLRALLDAGHDVRLVVTQPDRAVGRSGTLRPPAVKQAALAAGLEVAQPRKVRGPKFHERLRALDLDLLVVVAYGRILPRSLLDLTPGGALNVHFSLLPRYRGAAPVQWALARGEAVTGVTTMQINEQLDEGDVLLRRETPIEVDEHAPALSRRLSDMGAELIVETLAALGENAVTPEPQDHTLATFAPVLSPADGVWSPDWSAGDIEGRIRGFDPWPGVWARRKRKRLRLIDGAALSGETSTEPAGTVLGLEEDGLRVACAEGTVLSLRQVQPDGRRAQSARDAVNGRQLTPGDVLEPA